MSGVTNDVARPTARLVLVQLARPRTSIADDASMAERSSDALPFVRSGASL